MGNRSGCLFRSPLITAVLGFAGELWSGHSFPTTRHHLWDLGGGGGDYATKKFYEIGRIRTC